ncbi:hypothetical protein OUZ56_020614 [Daphnia magna]|uniref:Secreted protein n=1 Tax=Daphnia magna TaxID=35525 RepID=A0ABQ9ZEX8_9CRUS|nr:hypothetical protein OUZ56_020614 [Daphnia magna]
MCFLSRFIREWNSLFAGIGAVLAIEVSTKQPRNFTGFFVLNTNLSKISKNTTMLARWESITSPLTCLANALPLSYYSHTI